MFTDKNKIKELLSKKWKHITVHCAATRGDKDYSVEDIRKMHLARGFNDIGYHILIKRDGTIHFGRPFTKWGAHVKGHNRNNIGICMVGGLDDNGKPVDNFTQEQYSSLKDTIDELVGILGIISSNIRGHRDWSPDINGDGRITQNEWIKMCPCFDVSDWLESLM